MAEMVDSNLSTELGDNVVHVKELTFFFWRLVAIRWRKLVNWKRPRAASLQIAVKQGSLIPIKGGEDVVAKDPLFGEESAHGDLDVNHFRRRERRRRVLERSRRRVSRGHRGGFEVIHQFISNDLAKKKEKKLF